MSDSGLLFLRESWKNFSEIGTFLQCSNSAAELLTDYAVPQNIEQTGLIIELGAGAGRVTEAIQKRIGPNQVHLAVEINPNLCNHLESRFESQIKRGRLIVANSCAGELEKYIDQIGLQLVSAISVLPFALRKRFPNEFKEKLVTTIYDRLVDGGVFAQFQYLFAWAFKRDDFNRTNRIFGNIEQKYAPLFGWIYQAQKGITRKS